VSPGGPTHVLLNDDVAEHIPGCNMAFKKDALAQIAGFDPLFRAAGDDVDLCWRLQEAGYAIGFSPVAMVWHFRRNTVRAYLKQQMGYGKAEALLYFKHPYRFNLLGQSRWLGRIYGGLTTGLLSRRPVIYYGTFGRGLFQTLYEPPESFLTYLPFTLEWNFVAGVLLLTSILSGEYILPSSLPFAISLASAATTATRARLDPRFNGLRARLLVMLLLYLGPLVRSFERYLWRLQGMGDVERVDYQKSAQKPVVAWLRRKFDLTYWNQTGREKEDLLHELMGFLIPRKHWISVDSGWNDWDVEVARGMSASARLKVVVESHGGHNRVFRIRTSLHLARIGVWGFVVCLALSLLGVFVGLPELTRMGAVLALLDAAAVLYQSVRLGRFLYHVLSIVAGKLELGPMDKSGDAA
jgi:hypothetical protein